MESVLDKIGFTVETKPSFFETSTTAPLVLPAAANFAHYKRGCSLMEWMEVQGPGAESQGSLRENISDCIRVA